MLGTVLVVLLVLALLGVIQVPWGGILGALGVLVGALLVWRVLETLWDDFRA